MKQADTQRIVTFFQNAPIDSATTLLDVAIAIVKDRLNVGQEEKPKRGRKRRSPPGLPLSDGPDDGDK